MGAMGRVGTLSTVAATVMALAVTLCAVGEDDMATTGQPYSQESHVYRTVDGHDIRAEVYRAPGDDIRPVVVYIHGGALIMGGREWISGSHRDRYLGAGYTIVSIDYRLAPETKLPDIIDDLTRAFRWIDDSAAGLLRVDTSRMAVIGHSAGGYLTLMAGLVAEPKPQALVSYYGYGDLVGEWYSEPDAFYRQRDIVTEADARAAVGAATISNGSGHDDRWKFYLYCRQQGLWPYEVGGGDLASLSPYCPLQHVDADYPPTLLLHGDEDTDVPYEQSTLMAQALRAAEVEHELRDYLNPRLRS